MEDQPAILRELLERVAGVMAIDEGRWRLELVFEAGRLARWWTHAESRPPDALRVYDERAALIAPSAPVEPER